LEERNEYKGVNKSVINFENWDEKTYKTGSRLSTWIATLQVRHQR